MFHFASDLRRSCRGQFFAKIIPHHRRRTDLLVSPARTCADQIWARKQCQFLPPDLQGLTAPAAAGRYVGRPIRHVGPICMELGSGSTNCSRPSPASLPVPLAIPPSPSLVWFYARIPTHHSQKKKFSYT